MKKLILVVSVLTISMILSPIVCRAARDNDPELLKALDDKNVQKAYQLIYQGADVNARGIEDGWTPLMYSTSCGDPNLVKLLIDKGADVNARIPSTGETPLMCAVVDKNIDIVNLLLDSGADVNAADTLVGWTPLHRAVLYRSLEITKLLIARGADVNAKSFKGEAALSMAEEANESEIAALLRAAGAK